MDLTPLYPLLVFVHVASAFLFAAGHGVSVVVAFAIRRERDPARLRGLLDLSNTSLGLAGVGMLLLLATGIVAGLVGNLWGRGWIWLSLVLFIVVGGLMTPIGGTWFGQLRRALGIRTRELKQTDPDPVPVPPAELEALLRSRRPELLLLVGGGGFLVILWLMYVKPF